jgi:hypothetical protein
MKVVDVLNAVARYPGHGELVIDVLPRPGGYAPGFVVVLDDVTVPLPELNALLVEVGREVAAKLEPKDDPLDVVGSIAPAPSLDAPASWQQPIDERKATPPGTESPAAPPASGELGAAAPEG